MVGAVVFCGYSVELCFAGTLCAAQTGRGYMMWLYNQCIYERPLFCCEDAELMDCNLNLPQISADYYGANLQYMSV